MSAGQHRGALPAEISWWVRWPVLTSPHPAEGMKSCSAVPAISLTAGNVFTAEPSELLGAVLVSTHKSWYPPHTGTPVLLCPLQIQLLAALGIPQGSQIFAVSGLSWIPTLQREEKLVLHPSWLPRAFYEGTNSDHHARPCGQATWWQQLYWLLYLLVARSGLKQLSGTKLPVPSVLQSPLTRWIFILQAFCLSRNQWRIGGADLC